MAKSPKPSKPSPKSSGPSTTQPNVWDKLNSIGGHDTGPATTGNPIFPSKPDSGAPAAHRDPGAVGAH